MILRTDLSFTLNFNCKVIKSNVFAINVFGISIGDDASLVKVASTESACIEENPP